MNDLKFAFRQLLKNPGFTAVAVITLALGIGGNTAIFSAVDAVLIRPLPYVDAGRLVMIWDEMSHIGFPKHYSTPAEWREWRQNNTVFADIAASQPVQGILSSDGEPEEVPARKVTANSWTVLSRRVAAARTRLHERPLLARWQRVWSPGFSRPGRLKAGLRTVLFVPRVELNGYVLAEWNGRALVDTHSSPRKPAIRSHGQDSVRQASWQKLIYSPLTR